MGDNKEVAKYEGCNTVISALRLLKLKDEVNDEGGEPLDELNKSH